MEGSSELHPYTSSSAPYVALKVCASGACRHLEWDLKVEGGATVGSPPHTITPSPCLELELCIGLELPNMRPASAQEIIPQVLVFRKSFLKDGV